MKKTALQKFLAQIILKQVKGSVYLIQAITDIQIEEALEKERKQIQSAHLAGQNYDELDEETEIQYYKHVYGEL